MYRTTLPVTTALLLVLCPVVVRAQTQPQPALPVYLDVRSSASDPSMAAFAGKLMELVMTDVNGIQPRIDASNPCTAFSIPTRVAPQQESPLPKVLTRPGAEGDRFAVVRLILEEHRPDGRATGPDWLLDYQLTNGWWSDGRAICPDVSSLHQTQRMSQAKLLDALNLAGRLIVSALANRSSATGVGVMVRVKPGKNASQELADDLSAFLASRIASTQEFRPVQTDASASGVQYFLDIEVGLSSSRASDPRTEIAGNLTVQTADAKGAATPLGPQRTDTLPGFFRQVADTALRRLYEAQAAARLSLDSPPGGASAPALASEARSLLCIDAPDANCKVEADLALAVLDRLPRESRPEFRSLVGRALAAARRYSESAKIFDEIADSPSASATDRLDALVRAGDAYARDKAYHKAAVRYGAWLAQSDQAGGGDARVLDVALKRAQALRIGHETPLAIDALVAAANRWPGAVRVNQELGRLVPDLNKAQLVSLLDQLMRVPVPNQFDTARLRASRRLASEHLREGAYPEAEQTLRTVARSDATEQVNVDLASLYLRWAASSGVSAERKAELLQEGVKAVLPAVRARTPDADDEFVRLNHERSDDASTRAEYQRMLATQSADPAALLSLMLVCNEYLLDFDCAYEAANALDQIAIGHEMPGRLVNILEIKVVHGDLKGARSLIDRLVADPTRMGEYRHIVFFYAAWVELAAGHQEAGMNMAAEWRREMQTVRAGQPDVNWIFNGATRVLANPPRLSKENAALLLSMVAAMESPMAPIPGLPRA